MSLSRIITSKTLGKIVSRGAINTEGIRLLDCTYVPGVKPDWKKYREELYGQFDKLSKFKSRGHEMYLSGHIEGAVHADLDLAMYPGQYERFSHYPPEIFEDYIRQLGVCRDEDIIVYGRGAYGGMMFAARFAWLFKSYGHEKVSLLDGGLAQWVAHGGQLTKEVPDVERGNWSAKDNFKKTLITFEELESVDGKYEEAPKVNPNDDDAEQKEKELKDWRVERQGKMFIDKTDETNFVDARPRAQFEGLEETGLDQMMVDASHIPGFHSTPVAEMVTKEGVLESPDYIKDWLKDNGLNEHKKSVTICNTGMQASLLAYGIEYAMPDCQPRLYSGSLKEMEARDPKKISGGHRHIPHKMN